MPKPYLINQPSGLYARFLIPAALQPKVGRRFLVVPLYHAPGDEARLLAARLAVALSEAFRKLRQGELVDDLLEILRDERRRHDLTMRNVKLPNGTVLGEVEINTPEDQAQLNAMMEASGVKPVPMAKKRDKDRSLGVWLAKWVGDMETAKKQAKTIGESKFALALFMGLVKKTQVDEITGDDCRKFFKQVVFWPPNATKRPEYRGLSIVETIEKSKTSGEATISQAAVNKHWQRLSRFFNYLIENGIIHRNPLKGTAKPVIDEEERTRRPFTQDELNSIFDSAAFAEWAKDHPHRWWIPQLGLYTGARITELSQLYVADVEVIEGIAGIHIAKRFPGQKIKNKPSKRFIPLPPRILEAGFLAFKSDVEKAGHERLFPHLPNNDGTGFGKQMSRRFSTYVKERGIEEDGLSFHAFRHTFATRLSRAGSDVPAIARITGHEVEGGVLPKTYIDPPTLPMRLETISQYNPDVSIPKYKQGQFDKSLKEAHDMPAKWAAEKVERAKKAKKKAKESKKAAAQAIEG